jgi:hypothetical protein
VAGVADCGAVFGEGLEGVTWNVSKLMRVKASGWEKYQE